MSHITCPKCGSVDDGVVDSRPITKFGLAVNRRRRLCRNCATRFVTIEFSEADLYKVLANMETQRQQRIAELKSTLAALESGPLIQQEK